MCTRYCSFSLPNTYSVVTYTITYKHNCNYVKDKLQITACVQCTYTYTVYKTIWWTINNERFIIIGLLTDQTRILYDTNRVITKRYVVFCNSSLGGQTSMFTLRGRIIITETGGEGGSAFQRCCHKRKDCIQLIVVLTHSALFVVGVILNRIYIIMVPLHPNTIDTATTFVFGSVLPFRWYRIQVANEISM